MANVTLVNPNRMKPGVGPIALDYLADALDVAGHEVGILDLCFSDDWQADVDAYFRSNEADLVGMTIRNTDDCYFASRDFFVPFYKQVIDRIRANTDAKIVLGGAGLSVAARPILEFTGADDGIVGPGEAAIVRLASDQTDPTDPTDPSDLPRTRQWIDNRRYFAEGGQAGVETKRGCDKKCIYCADPVGKGTVCRLRPPSLVVDEFKALLAQGIDCFHLCDAEFNIPISHAEAVCRELISSGVESRIRWYTYASPTPFTDELAGLMKQAGCAGIDFGADSGDDDVLRSLGRDFTSEDVRRTAEICHRHGITFMYDLLIGGPGETLESVDRTFSLMKEIEPDRVGISVGVRIYGGTAIGRMVRKQGISPANKNLHGIIEGNENFLAPIYYLNEAVGLDVIGHVDDLIAGDSRFLHASMEQIDANYNYNDNSVLVQAIKAGHRGAYWDILRRLHNGQMV